MPQKKTPSIKDKLDALKKNFKGIEETRVIEKLKKVKSSKPKKSKGGARPGSGRKPKMEFLIAKGHKQLIDDFVGSEDMVEVTLKDGKKITLKKSRVLIALEMLYYIGIEDRSSDALNKFLDRAMGKPAQPIKGDGDDDAPIKMEVDIKSILSKAYGDDDSDSD